MPRGTPEEIQIASVPDESVSMKVSCSPYDTAHVRGSSIDMHCSQTEANRKLRERVVKFARLQTIATGAVNFGDLRPTNFTGLSEFVGRLTDRLLQSNNLKEGDSKNLLLLLRTFTAKDPRQRSANRGQFLSSVLFGESELLRREVVDTVVARFEQMVHSTQQYLFEMTPVGAPQTGIASFLGRCDSTNLRFCTQEMYGKNVCKCIESYGDLRDQLRFVIFEAHHEFEGIPFCRMEKINDGTAASIVNSVLPHP